MAPDHRAADSSLAAEHAALRAQYDELQEKLERETRAHDRERKSHAATAAQLALLRAAHPAPEARKPANGMALRIARWQHGLQSRQPALHARLQRVSLRHPRIRRLLRTTARLAWWTVTLQLPGRIATRWKHAQAPRFKLRPLLPSETTPGRQPGTRRLVCITHLLPYPPRAGNEYRISRLLPWLSQQGWEVLLVVCPPPGAELTEEPVRQAAAVFPNLIVCGRDGAVLHHVSCDAAMLAKLAGRRPRNFPVAPGAAADQISERTRDLLRGFCPDILIELLLHIEAHFAPQVLLAEYVFMTRPFPLFGPNVRKVIDTIDVFSNKRRKVKPFGIADPFNLDEREEACLLERADLLIAIQPQEAADLRRLAPELPVISAGVDFDIPDPVTPPALAPVILLIGSDNEINAKGLADFLRFAWPLVRRAVPDAQLHVVGAVGARAELATPGIRNLGRIEDLGAAYAHARVVVNPAVAGTGLKVKTVEALCHFRPVVAWPAGVEGVAPQARALCHVAGDWFDFAQLVIALVRSPDEDRDMAQQQQELRSHFSPDCVYAALAEALHAPWSPRT
jgi:Glycosyl transferases group 1